MRIAYVCADRGVPVFGRKGCSIHVQEVIRAFRETGASVELFAASLGGDPPADLVALPVHLLPRAESDDRRCRELSAIAAGAIATREIAAHGPFDLVYERYSLWSAAGMCVAAAEGIPGVLEVNAPLIDEQDRYRGLIHRREADLIARENFGMAKTLVAVSPGVASYLASFPAAKGRIHIVPNGVRLARFPERRGEPIQENRPYTIGFVGTLKPWHGVDTMLDAFRLVVRSHGEARLLIVGDGPEAGPLKSKAEHAGFAGKVTFTGAVAADEIPALLARMDAAVAPYPNEPGFYFSPLKVYEYMAAGLPVVASRIGELATLIRHQHNGLLCTPGDAEALARSLGHLIANPCWGRELGRAARATIARGHTWSDRVRLILEVAKRAPLHATGTG